MSKRSKCPRTRSSQGEAHPFAGMWKVTPQATGVDSGAREIVACVPDGDDQQIVRTFGTYTADLQTLADWCVTVASRRPPWHPQASLGSRFSRHWKRAASGAA
jgi:hypothetical protein